VSVVSGLLYSSTRLFWLSAMYKSPLESNATPIGSHRLPPDKPPLLQLSEVKLPACPKTRSATVLVVSGVLYSSTRLLLKSAT
jgi:hypothetical protein